MLEFLPENFIQPEFPEFHVSLLLEFPIGITDLNALWYVGAGLGIVVREAYI